MADVKNIIIIIITNNRAFSLDRRWF